MSSKLTDEELEKIQDLQDRIYNKTFDFGRQKYIISEMEKQLEEEKKAAKEIEEDIQDLKEEHDRFANSLYKKYGDIAIDTETGEYRGTKGEA